MKRVLLTGMSGTGKSTLIRELAARGFKAVDLDSDQYSEWVIIDGKSPVAGSPVEPERDWVWREDRVQDLFSAEDADVLFVSGCAQNMRMFLPQFDEIVLLSAPNEVIINRLVARGGNSYGKLLDEIARVLDLVEAVEPLLRNVASYEIDTSADLDEVLTALLRLAS